MQAHILSACKSCKLRLETQKSTSMAPSSSLFDRLPDEMVTFILGFLGSSISSSIALRQRGSSMECAEDLFRVQLVCGLTNFVNHKQFSVAMLNLLITDKIEKLQHHLNFSSALFSNVCQKQSTSTAWDLVRELLEADPQVIGHLILRRAET